MKICLFPLRYLLAVSTVTQILDLKVNDGCQQSEPEKSSVEDSSDDRKLYKEENEVI